ncbi:hypothetical protein ACGH2B_12345 [Streptomyces sp. BBFR2]|uniref:hypothetical protein n=1 Tax=Streptomyces sp. BBFR2 TaxID=3372854 RepID=UPI0037DA32FB
MGLLGLLSHDSNTVMNVGIIMGLVAVPGIVAASVDRAHRVADDQLAASHRAGYELALDHVARGLLDAPAPPSPGRRDDHAEQVAGNVIPLRPHPIQQSERKAL